MTNEQIPPGVIKMSQLPSKAEHFNLLVDIIKSNNLTIVLHVAIHLRTHTLISDGLNIPTQYLPNVFK